jgi:GNAT superfamily N-acetyltransferase
VSRYRPTEPLDHRRHQTESFASGQETLDLWLRAYAAQGERRGATRTFVVADPTARVHGYYALVAPEVKHEAATRKVRSGMSRHFPIPVVLIARLAVDREYQGRGLGRSLLLDALQRIDRASVEIGLRAVLVHAIDDRAAEFYRRYGFESSGLDPNTLMVTMGDVRRVVGGRSGDGS